MTRSSTPDRLEAGVFSGLEISPVRLASMKTQAAGQWHMKREMRDADSLNAVVVMIIIIATFSCNDSEK